MREDKAVWLAPFFLKDHYVCEITLLRPLNDLFELEVLAGVVLHSGDGELKLF